MENEIQEVQEVTELDSWDDVEASDIGDSNDEVSTEVVEEGNIEGEVPEPKPEDQSFEDIDTTLEANSESSEELPSEEGSEIVPPQSEEEAPTEEIASFNVKVDGEEVEVSLDDLKNNYSGKVAYDKKFNELNVERKEHEAELSDVNNYINHFANMMREGDALGAMSYFAEFGGVAPHVFEQQIITSLMPVIQRYQEMDPDKIDLEYKNKEAEYYRSRLESKEQNDLIQQSNQELSLKESSLREAHGFTNEEWDQASAYVKTHLESQADYSPELIRDFMVNEKAEIAVEAVDASLLDNKVFMAAFETLIYENGDFTHQDLVGHLQSLYEDKVEEPKKEEVRQGLTNKLQKQQTTKQKKKVTIEPIKDEYGDEVQDWEDFL